MKILFFISNIGGGGKERRFVELLSYLKAKQYDIKVVLAYNEIAYNKFYTLGLEPFILNKKYGQKSLAPIFEFYKICKDFRPDIIHTWGAVETFYAIPTKFLLKVPLIDSEIADCIGLKKKNLFFKFVSLCNFVFSDVICANSHAGLRAYAQDKKNKSVVVYNGLDENRFIDLADQKLIKEKYGIKTRYAIIMAATYSANKDWDRFCEVAKYVVTKRRDITFVGVGAEYDGVVYNRIKNLTKNYDRILIKGHCCEVENLVNACDIGVLFSTQGEGVSNTILEYLALGKPVVVDKEGGSSEFIENGVNGFFVKKNNTKDIGDVLINLIDNKQQRDKIAFYAQKTIQDKFTLQSMGYNFERIYKGFYLVEK